jgi:hypothetical protein
LLLLRREGALVILPTQIFRGNRQKAVPMIGARTLAASEISP